MFEKFENEPPKVVGVSIRRNGQKIRIYNETTLNKFDLQDMTRRNSHPRADMRQLYEEFGAVLISRYDLGSLLDEQLSAYLLDIEFEIEFESEPNTETVTTTESEVLAVIMQNAGNNILADAEANAKLAATARYNARIQNDTRATVLFLYDDGSRLEGNSSKMQFVKTIY